VCGVGTGTSCRQIFKDYKTLTVTFVCICTSIGMLYKEVHIVTGAECTVHHYNTTEKMDLHVFACNTNLCD
jgi:hypothetical protein